MRAWEWWFLTLGFAVLMVYGVANLWMKAGLESDRAAYHAAAVAYLTRWEATEDLDPRALIDPQAGRLVFLGVRSSLSKKAHAALILPTPKPNVTRIVIFNRSREPQTFYTEIVQD